MKLHTEKAIEPFKNQSTKCVQIHCLPCFNDLTIAQPKKTGTSSSPSEGCDGSLILQYIYIIFARLLFKLHLTDVITFLCLAPSWLLNKIEENPYCHKYEYSLGSLGT